MFTGCCGDICSHIMSCTFLLPCYTTSFWMKRKKSKRIQCRMHLLLRVLCSTSTRMFRQVTMYVKTHQSSFNLMIMLGFFTSAALQRLFNSQTQMPGTAKVISTFVLSLKPDLPEVLDWSYFANEPLKRDRL